MVKKSPKVLIPNELPGAKVYQLKIVLKDMVPVIWRRIQIGENTTLNGLNRILQLLMGWHDSDSHEFNIGKKYYGTPADEFLVDEKKIRLKALNLRKDQKFNYWYHMDDEWEMQILIEGIFPTDSELLCPICIGGERRGPIEGCGGPHEYNELLNILRNPDHEEYQEMTEWFGEKFDPEVFDIYEVNKRFQSIRKW